MAKAPKRPQHKTRSAQTLYYDIETAPNIGEFWDVKQPYNIIRTLRYSYMLSVAWQINDGPIFCKALPDFPLYTRDKHDDYALVKFLHKLISDADISIGHNGDNFDDKYSNARFIHHRLGPPSPRKTRDTLKLSKRVTKQVSHRLDELARYYGIGSKLPHTGKHLWEEVTDKVYHPKAWKTMREYNKHDVYLLKEVATLLLPWDNTKTTNPNLITRKAAVCPKLGCGSTLNHRRGKEYVTGGYRWKFQCLSCLGWFTEKEIQKMTKLVYS